LQAPKEVREVSDLPGNINFFKMDIEHLYHIFRQSSGVCTDSRAIQPGTLFFALKGETFDGNSFALKAVESGALYAVVDDSSLPEHEKLILVEDVLKTLQQLARYHRRKLGLPIIGITGTNGKTTTKELISRVLMAEYRISYTQGNLNNHIGVPLTLLKMDENTQIGVVEMGASAPGEIATLVDICEPDYGVVTNVGKAHLLGFGSFEGVVKTKGELYDYLKKNDGTVIYNIDNPDLCSMIEKREPLKSIPYGMSCEGAVLLPVTAENPFMRIRLDTGEEVDTKLVGAYNADNVMAALAVGKLFFIDTPAAHDAIRNYVPTNNRSQLVSGKFNKIIIDAYNANPTSMRAALSNFAMMEKRLSAMVIGDMLELGDESRNEHKAILEVISSMNADVLFFVGKEYLQAARSFGDIMSKARFFDTSAELKDFLIANPLKNHTVLVKGSRGTCVEKVVEAL